MDRTSILGDTIDYTKELLERIKSLQQEVEAGSNMDHIFKGEKPNEMLVRNTPKVILENSYAKVFKYPYICWKHALLQFEVERRTGDTRIEICCRGDPGLLLSTVATMEALGLEIQQCVVSCFNDFAMHASCSEVTQLFGFFVLISLKIFAFILIFISGFGREDIKEVWRYEGGII